MRYPDTLQNRHAHPSIRRDKLAISQPPPDQPSLICGVKGDSRCRFLIRPSTQNEITHSLRAVPGAFQGKVHSLASVRGPDVISGVLRRVTLE